MPVSEIAPAFPVPFAAPENQSWRDIGASLRNNALAGFPSRVFEDMVVMRSFAGRQQIILSDPDAIRHVLIENNDNYRRTAATRRLLAPVLGRGILLATGEDWRAQRRAAAPSLAPRMMPGIAHIVAQACDRLIAELAAPTGRPGGEPGGELGGKPIDLFGRLQLLALEIAGTALFSLDLTEEGPALRAELQAYADGVGRPTPLDFLLPRGLPTPRSLARWRFRRRWMTRIARILEERRAEPIAASPDIKQTGDLFDMMRNAAVSDRVLIEQAATMLAAGHETTAVALFWSCYILARAPAAQRRIADEAGSLDLSPAAAAEALSRLPYTRAVIDETLRLYPPAFSIIRQARGPDIAAGVTIPPRAVILIVPWVLHRHKALWRDPDLFMPERFLPGAEPPTRFSYLPFGAGPRACIGAQFALTEAVLVLARLVREFEIELADPDPVLPLALITLQPDHRPPFRLRRR
jgi:cytochrome P450